jgi:hypothetical protein
MTDPTEDFRRAMLASGQPARDLVQAQERWTTEELREQFEVTGFLAPFVVVRRKADGVVGSLEFTHNPRVYFNFRPAGMTTLCIQCAMRALLDDKPSPTFDETPEQHARRCHPDPVTTRRERMELERLLAQKMMGVKDNE